MAKRFSVEAVITAKDEASKVIKRVGDSAQEVGKRFEDIGLTLERTGKRMTTLVTLPILGAGAAAIKTAADFEQTQIAFTSMLGSAEKAKTLLKDLTDFGAKTPFQLSEVEQGAKQLLAMGAATENIIPELRMLGDVSAGLGVPMERLILNFGQVRLQGKLTGRELRDFAVAGVPLIDELADSLGVAKDEVANLVSEGKVGFEDVRVAFQNMTSEGGIFHNLMQDQSETTAGKFSNLKDETEKLARAIGLELLPFAETMIEKTKDMVETFGELSPEIQRTIILLAGIIAIIGPLLTSIGLMIGAISLTTITIGAFIAALIFWGIKIKREIDKAKEAFEVWKNAVKTIMGLAQIPIALFRKHLKNEFEKAEFIIEQLKATLEMWKMGAEMIFESVKSAVTSFKEHWVRGFEKMISPIKDAIDKLNEFEQKVKNLAREKIGEFGNQTFRRTFGFDFPFQEGGIVNRPTRALIGEAGPEAVIPLDRVRNLGGAQIVINVNGLVPITAGQRREVGMMLWKEIQNAAKQQNISPVDL